MAIADRRPWYREPYIIASALIVALGLWVVGADCQARHAKGLVLASKFEADQLYKGQQYEQAEARYGKMIAMAAGYRDSEVVAAAEESRKLRGQAQGKIAEGRAEEARRLAALAEEREREARILREREDTLATLRAEQDPVYVEMLESARKHEADCPGWPPATTGTSRTGSPARTWPRRRR